MGAQCAWNRSLWGSGFWLLSWGFVKNQKKNMPNCVSFFGRDKYEFIWGLPNHPLKILHISRISDTRVQFWVRVFFGTDGIGFVQWAGRGWTGIRTHTLKHRALYPGNVRNLRSEVLRRGYPLSSDTRQLLTLWGCLVIMCGFSTYRL